VIHSPPPQAVREAFGVTGEPLPLSGGQQTVWRVGEAVLNLGLASVCRSCYKKMYRG